jgi:hypothetical protein
MRVDAKNIGLRIMTNVGREIAHIDDETIAEDGSPENMLGAVRVNGLDTLQRLWLPKCE